MLELKCPKCNTEFIQRDMWDYDMKDGEDCELEFTCPKCGHEFEATVCLTISCDYSVTEYCGGKTNES